MIKACPAFSDHHGTNIEHKKNKRKDRTHETDHIMLIFLCMVLLGHLPAVASSFLRAGAASRLPEAALVYRMRKQAADTEQSPA
jgi:hypothetical protein